MSPRKRYSQIIKGSLNHALEVCDKTQLITVISSKTEVDGKAGLEVLNMIKKSREMFKDHLTPLQGAITLGNYSMCKALVEEGAELESSCSVPHPLCLALQKSRYDIARFLIKSGANVNLPFDEKLPLCFALDCEQCPLAIVKDIIDAGFPVNDVINFNSGKTALHAAVNMNNIEIVKYLISIPANTDVKDKRSLTPLHYAVQKDYNPLVKLLAEAGASVDTECLEHYTPMCYAIATGNYEMVKLLLHVGANVHYVNANIKCSMMPLHFAANFNKLKILQLLLEEGADVNRVIPMTGEIALHSATRAEVQTSQTKVSLDCIVELLIREGSNLDAIHRFGWTPLVSALKSKNFSVAKILIINGANINLKIIESNNRFYSPIHVVARTFDRDLIKLSLDYGGDLMLKDHDGMYPCQTTLVTIIVDNLTHSSDCSHSLHGKHTNSDHNESIFKFFWKYGFPFDLTMDIKWLKPGIPAYPTKLVTLINKQKMLFNGLKAQNAKMVQKAIAQGAEVKCISKEQPYPLHYIAARGDEQIMKEFVTRGVPVNSLNKNRETPLYLAAKGGHVNCCRLLLEHGAVYNYLTKGKTPLEVAKTNNHSEVEVLLTTINRFFKQLKNNNLKNFKPDMKIFQAAMNCYNRDGRTLLGRAIHLGLNETASRLIKYRVHV